MKKNYKKLADNLENKKKMDNYYKKLEYEKNLLSKDSRKIKKYKDGEYHKFFMERKR
jgi:cell division protein FtsL